MTAHDAPGQPSILIVRNTDDGGAPVLVVARLDDAGAETVVHSLPYENLIQGYRDLAPVLSTELEGGIRSLVVDLANIPWIDSTGIGTLVGVTRDFRDGGGSVALANARPRVAGVFRLTGLEALFRLFNSVEEAVGWLREGGD